MQTIEPAKRRHRHKRRRTRAWAVGETWGAGVIPEPTEIERKLRRARIIGWTVAIILGMAATLIAIAITSRPFEPTPVEPREAGTWHPFKSMDY